MDEGDNLVNERLIIVLEDTHSNALVNLPLNSNLVVLQLIEYFLLLS